MTTPTVPVFTPGQRVKHGQWTGEVVFVDGDQVTVRIGDTDGVVNAADLSVEPPVVLQFGDRVLYNNECGIFLETSGDDGIVAQDTGLVQSWPRADLQKIVCPFVVGDQLMCKPIPGFEPGVKYTVFFVGIGHLCVLGNKSTDCLIPMRHLRNLRKVSTHGKRPAAVVDDTASTAVPSTQQPRLYTEQYVRDYALMYDCINHHAFEFGLKIGNDGNSISDPENVISLLRANKRGFVLEHNRIVVRARE